MSYDLPGDGGSALVLPPESDGTWSAGRVVTLVVPLARSLAELHARGLVHGAVGRYAVRCTPEGRPEFTDEAGSRPRSDAATPAADIRALARLGTRLLDPSAPDGAGVLAVLAAAAGGRLDAGELADRLVQAARAEPLHREVGSRRTPTSHRAPRRHRVSAGRFGRRFAPPNRVGRTPGSRRGLLAACVGAAGLIAFVIAASLTGGTDPAVGDVGSPVPLSVTTQPIADQRLASEVNWTAVVERLTAARVAALTSGDRQRLRHVYVAGAAPAVADAALLRAWRVRHRRVVGLDAEILRVRAVETTSSTAVLRVTQMLSAYRVVDRRGVAVIRSSAQRQSVRLVLVRRGSGWLVRQVRRPQRQSTSAESAASTSS